MKRIVGFIRALIRRYQNWKVDREIDRLIAEMDKELPIEIDE